jgi:hypothetical protein
MFVKCHSVFRQGKTDRLLNLLTVLRNRFQQFIHWGIKILLATPGTDPGRDVIDIDDLTTVMESGTDVPRFDHPFTGLTWVSVSHPFTPLQHTRCLPLRPFILANHYEVLHRGAEGAMISTCGEIVQSQGVAPDSMGHSWGTQRQKTAVFHNK